MDRDWDCSEYCEYPKCFDGDVCPYDTKGLNRLLAWLNRTAKKEG